MTFDGYLFYDFFESCGVDHLYVLKVVFLVNIFDVFYLLYHEVEPLDQIEDFLTTVWIA